MEMVIAIALITYSENPVNNPTEDYHDVCEKPRVTFGLNPPPVPSETVSQRIVRLGASTLFGHF
ncbi:hypothetical protein RRF57_013224 [Xylaria bambusicola]|uniref:Uncharacterized protein n=1 Tax=Xylaria bambusicola TaxID=326684 RepID=A0AAN7UZ31_9PEZI